MGWDGRKGVYFGHGMGEGCFGAYEVFPAIVGLRVAGSKIEAQASPGKPKPTAHTPPPPPRSLPRASPKPIIMQHNPTSEIMSDELLSN